MLVVDLHVPLLRLKRKGKRSLGPTTAETIPYLLHRQISLMKREGQKPLEYDVIAHLRRIPARYSIYEALQLSKESREALINALVNESVRDFYLAESTGAADCAQTITFTDEDLLLGDYEHNRPLFVTGDLAGERINRILLDAGSAVNILPLKTLKKVGLTPAQLRSSNLMIQGFNQGGQRTMGVITLDLDIQGFLTQVNCHVINAPTSYNLLLGRPWLHRYKVVASTAHQCFKFDQNGELRRIMADTRPFAVTESFYSDSQYDILAPDSDEPRTNEETISRPRREIVTQEKEEPRFVVDSQITPE